MISENPNGSMTIYYVIIYFPYYTYLYCYYYSNMYLYIDNITIIKYYILCSDFQCDPYNTRLRISLSYFMHKKCSLLLPTTYLYLTCYDTRGHTCDQIPGTRSLPLPHIRFSATAALPHIKIITILSFIHHNNILEFNMRDSP